MYSNKKLENEIQEFAHLAIKLSKNEIQKFDRDKLERWSVDLGNLASEMRREIEDKKSSAGLMLIVESIKIAERQIQDASDWLLEMRTLIK